MSETGAMGYECLYRDFAQFRADYAPPWGLPTREDFRRIGERHGVQYPEAFIVFQTGWAARLPSFHGLCWANAGLEPYLSLEALIADARALGLAGLRPFAEDEGDFIGFPEAAMPDADAPVVRYDHAGGAFHVEARDFAGWLRVQYLRYVAACPPARAEGGDDD